MEQKDWIYFGIFLDDKSKSRTLEAVSNNGVSIPNDWKIFNHHMTIAFNNHSEEAEKLYNYYRRYIVDMSPTNLVVDGIGYSEEAIALRVRWNLPIANKIPHITIATPPNGKPVNSNKITTWVDIRPFTLAGWIREFKKS